MPEPRTVVAAEVPERGAAGLAVDVDLRLELLGAAETSTEARISGHGQRVRIDAARPEVLLSAVDRTDVGRIADLLGAVGLSVEVHGPHNAVATLGSGTTSRFGRLLTGSSRVAPAARGATGLIWAGRPGWSSSVVLPGAIALLVAFRRLRRRA